jgi:hypothetical protein
MTQISIKTNAPLVRQGLENLTKEIPAIGRRRIYNTMRKIQARMRKPGKSPHYPIKWDSEKQRRAFFATKGFGRGIPTTRTGQYTSGWKIVKQDTGYQLTNQVGYTKYVGGDAYGQIHSGIHVGRWPVLRDEVEAEIKTLPDEIEKEIKLVARRNNL